MRIISTIAVGAALAGALLATPVLAHSSTPGVDARQHNQQHRIEDGVKSGALTPAEAARLKAGQRRIERMEVRIKSDGRVRIRERSRLRRAQRHESRTIYRMKHNYRFDDDHYYDDDHHGRRNRGRHHGPYHD